MDVVNEGAYLLLLHGRRSWLIRVEKGKRMHTHLGIIDVDDAIGREYGSYIESSLGKRIYLLKPITYDYVMKGERRTQIVYPKDMGYIASRLGICSGANVLEIGMGSGALTTFIASIVRPHGHVYSYEVREEFIQIARRNLSRLGLEDHVTIINRDASAGMLEVSNMDAAVIDVGDPWSVLDNVYHAMKGSAPLCAICPTMNQLERLSVAFRDRFVDVEFTELMIRHMEAREGMTRPMFRMIGHTAYLAFGRKVVHGCC
ncbi:MAG: tRNA (adenine-N1)-methyltransferase [Candidatus Nitrosocaldus sp.]|nr:tRNA (adenine-N1)-methyltransferase [Candidatus Nitrosocaldus sp.]MCS7140632.1 tRNA (adenine-N1)-methyltransferase [Candidatus Nitrosocaldus sp.]MDW7999553.1 tRNA (adenine-N1)-methyltransferase [Candidatus Nitrosocaldus sp.]MDW8276357.1 tRNA (adenine-N1)-methyltransferase [Candidatus Nitrosocaldus sp.]